MLKSILRKLRAIFPLVIILVVTFLLFTYRLTEVPPGINGDEASIGYNAALISKTLHDENNKLLPLFVHTLDQKDWKQPVNIYLTAGLFKIFEPSFYFLRFSTVAIVLISIVLLFLLLKELFSLRLGYFGLLLFITTPIIFIQSHLALENITPIPFVVLWLLFLVKYLKVNKSNYLFLSGAMLGISIFSYNGMRLVAPVLLLLSLIFLYFNKMPSRRTITKICQFLSGVIPFLLLLLFTKSAYPGAIFGSARPVLINNFKDLITPYISSYDLSFLYITGDITPYHSTGDFGVFLVSTLPIFIFGCYQIARKKDAFLSLILLSFFLAPLLFGFVNSIHRASRLLVMVPFYIVILVAGIEYISEILKKSKYKIIIFSVMIIMVVSNFTGFVYDYWFQYPLRVQEHFLTTTYPAFNKLSKESKKRELMPVIQYDLYKKDGVAADFFKQVYFSENLKIWKLKEILPDNSVILANPGNLNTEQLSELQRIDDKSTTYGLFIIGKNHLQ